MGSAGARLCARRKRQWDIRRLEDCGPEQMLRLEPVVLELRESAVLPLMRRIEDAYIERFGEDPEDKGGWLHEDAWLRLSRVFEVLDKGGDVLDVGSGAGQFANALALSGEFRSVATVDPTRFRKYVELDPSIRRLDVSVGDLPFEDKSFDVVVCMEVLEHIPVDIFSDAIAELRRVARTQLVITVPYREPEPLSATHVRRFEDDSLVSLFPSADFIILNRPRMPWVLIEERPHQPARRRAVAKDPELDIALETIERLRDRVAALKARKVVRIADTVGRGIRTLTRSVHKSGSGRSA